MHKTKIQWDYDACFFLMVCMIVLVLTGCGNTSSVTVPKTTEEVHKGGAGKQDEEINPVKSEQNEGFQWTPYMWNDLYTQIYGEQFHDDFDAYVNAALNYEESFICVNEENTWKFYDFQEYVCPVISVLVSDTSYENGTCHISYSVSQNEADKIIAAFRERIEKLVNESTMPDDSDSMKAFMLYYNYVQKLTYDYDAIYSAEITDWFPYRGLMEYTGICQSFAGGYSYLCNQCGIEATVVYGKSDTQNEAHVWSLVRLDGDYYYMDPTFNLRDESGVSYYGMTTDRRIMEGDFLPGNYNICYSGELNGNDINVDNSKYETLWESVKVVAVERNSDRVIVRYENADGEEKIFEIR